MPITPNFEPIKQQSAGVNDIPGIVALVFHVTIGLAGAIFC